MKEIYLLALSISLLFTSCASSEKSKLRDSIASVFASEQSTGNLKKCYESALKNDPNTNGRIVINFKIDDLSNARDINIVEEETTIKDPDLKTCLMNNVQSLKFPAAPKNDFTHVSYPFKLQHN